MKNYIITISDDLDIFESIESAEKYLEPWILEQSHNFRAYDKHGNILNASVILGKKIKLTLSEKKNIELLKSEILDYLPRLSKITLSNVESKSLNELIDYLIKNRGITK